MVVCGAMIEPMAKIEIVGLIENLDGALEVLQDFGFVQIDEIPTVESDHHAHMHRIHLDEKKEQLRLEYENLLETLNDLLDILNTCESPVDPLTDMVRDELNSLGPEGFHDRITSVSREVKHLARHRKNLHQDIDSAQQYEKLINTFLPLIEKGAVSEHMEQIGLILKEGESSVLPILKNRIGEITGSDAMIIHQQMPDNTTGVFIIVTPDHLTAVRNLLGNEGVAEYHIPREFRRRTFRESIESINDRVDEIYSELNSIDKQIADAKKSHGALFRYVQIICTNRLNQLRVLPRLVRTKYTFVISGWTPLARYKRLEEILHVHFGSYIHLGRVMMNNFDILRIPTLLANRGIFKASEILMKLFPPPKYGNIDATTFIAVFFPVFFGIILGDMAYGLVLLVIGGLFRWKWAGRSIMSDVGTITLAAGLSTVVFGFLYGEFLGNFGARFGLHAIAPWLHREQAIVSMLLITLGIGIFHIVLGFALKIYINILMKHTRGVLEGAAKIIVITGMVGIFSQLLLGLPLFMRYAGYCFCALGVAGVVLSEGAVGLLELFSLFGNILSYSRIMAIGLASVILAAVANRLAEMSENIIIAVLVGVGIHLINFIMGVFSPTIHSLRLHYVEFFSKFFVATGKAFQPFKKIREDYS